MKEIWRMWRMARLLLKNRSSWAYSFKLDKIASEGAYAAVKEEKKEKEDIKEYKRYTEIKDEIIKKFPKYMSHIIKKMREEPRVKRETLLKFYVDTYYSERWGVSREHFMLDAQSVIQSCIDDENMFIEVDKNDENLIYFTRSGKAFASIDGLLKEEITRGVGILWSVLISLLSGILSVLGFIKWEAIWNFLAKISPWW